MAYRILLLLMGAAAAAEQHGPFTKDFVKFMQRNPEKNEYALSAYEEYGADGSFGGRKNNEKLTHTPVLFIHGNSDSALWHSISATGWTASVEYFKSQGYNGSELYGVTYGSRNIANAIHNSITCRNLVGIRRLIEAILAYTQADKIDIVAHSMGVSLARKAIQGGMVHMTEEVCYLGDSIDDKVDSLVAISGANYGMCMCLDPSINGQPACGAEGFTPGTCGKTGNVTTCGTEEAECSQDDYAAILRQINEGEKEASFIASLWSDDDPVVGKNNFAWGRKTSEVPNSDLTHAYDGFNHFEMKDKTFKDQYRLVTVHSRHSVRARRHH